MKTLYILGSRISQYYKKNKLLFLLFLLGGILNAVSMIYCYGNLLPYIRDRASMDLKYRDYTVSFQYWETDERGSAIGDTPITNLPDPEDVLSFIAEPLLEGCEITAQNSVCTSTGNYPYTVVRGTTEFTGPYQVFSNCPNLKKIYVPAELIEEYKTHEFWSLYADKFTAIGGVQNA